MPTPSQNNGPHPVRLTLKDLSILAGMLALFLTGLWFVNRASFFDKTDGTVLQTTVIEQKKAADKIHADHGEAIKDLKDIAKVQAESSHRIELRQREIGTEMGIRWRLDRVAPMPKEKSDTDDGQ